jgi:hypothetical protein
MLYVFLTDANAEMGNYKDAEMAAQARPASGVKSEAGLPLD